MSNAQPLQAWVVVDLGFGDAGKGLLTDHLVRTAGARLVVRFNGGAQAGHNVVAPDGRHHTFAQFGAASFVPGVRTFLSRHVLLHPGALLVEGETLRRAGVPDVFSRLRVSEAARVITPFHQAANRLRELARGDARHGSCGVGVGETVSDALTHPEDTLTAGELHAPGALRAKLLRVRERKRAQLLQALGGPPDAPAAAREWSLFERDEALEAWLALLGHFARLDVVVPEEPLASWVEGPVVFEGAQGVLLDEDAGFHPHTTWSRCTAANALELLSEGGHEVQLTRVGVLRSHGVRHGAGPFPTHLEAGIGPVDDANRLGPWQGAVRYGAFDAVLARYALEVMGGVDVLALTHLDALAQWKNAPMCTAYDVPLQEGDAELVARRSAQGHVERLAVARTPDLPHQERLGGLLGRARPVLEHLPPQEAHFLARLEALLGRRVDLVSRGPRASDVEPRTPSPPGRGPG